MITMYRLAGKGSVAASGLSGGPRYLLGKYMVKQDDWGISHALQVIITAVLVHVAPSPV